MKRKLKAEWGLDSSLDLLRRYGIWPDSIEDGKILLEHAYNYIECFPGDGRERIDLNKSIIKDSFNKKYEKKS